MTSIPQVTSFNTRHNFLMTKLEHFYVFTMKDCSLLNLYSYFSSYTIPIAKRHTRLAIIYTVVLLCKISALYIRETRYQCTPMHLS